MEHKQKAGKMDNSKLTSVNEGQDENDQRWNPDQENGLEGVVCRWTAT